MMTFKEFTEANKPASKYIALIYNDETQNRLRHWAYQNGFDLSVKYDGSPITPTDFEFHTTIFYTQTKHSLMNCEFQTEDIYVYPQNFEMLGEDLDIPVMRVDGHGLRRYKEYYRETYQMEDVYPDWKPHVSLTYNREYPVDISKVRLPDFHLVGNLIRIKDNEL